MNRKKTSRRPVVRRDDLRQEIGFGELVDLCNEVWIEEVTSDAPNWGHALGVHVRLSELEHLAEAAQELLP
ncbi:MAG: hypothetical protein ACRDQZ_12410 [Mycobacteriales bacterium]